MKSIDNTEIKNKKVIFRADLNLPLLDGKITDYSRINAILPSLKNLIKRKNKIFIIAHYGRPNGIVNKKYSLEFLCKELAKILNIKRVYFLNNFDDFSIKNQIDLMEEGQICLFENVRFNPEEERNDINFAKKISYHFDFFVCFGVDIGIYSDGYRCFLF